MENTAGEEFGDLFGTSQGTMQPQALGQHVNSGFYVSQETDHVCGMSKEEGQSLTNALLLRLPLQNIFTG